MSKNYHESHDDQQCVAIPWIAPALLLHAKVPFHFLVLHSAVGSRHFTISNFHTNRTRIDWVNRLCTCVEKTAFISHFTICIWWWLSYIFPTNIYKPTGTHCNMLTMIPKRPLLHEFKNGREIQRRARWAAAPSTLCNSRILHEQIVKWNGSQTYISQDIYHIHEHMLFFFRCCSLYALAFSHCYLNCLLDFMHLYGPHHCLFLANTSFDSFSATFLLTVQSQPYNHWSLRVKKENECIPSNGTKVQTNRNNVTFSMYNFEDKK